MHPRAHSRACFIGLAREWSDTNRSCYELTNHNTPLYALWRETQPTVSVGHRRTAYSDRASAFCPYELPNMYRERSNASLVNEPRVWITVEMYHTDMSGIKACCFSSVPTSSQHNQIQHPATSNIQPTQIITSNTNLPLQDAPSVLHDKLPTTRHHALQGTPFNNSTFAFVVPPAKTRPLANRRVPHRSTKPRHGMRFIPPLPLRKQRRFLRRHRHDQCMRRRRIRAHDLHGWAQVLRDDPRQRLWNCFRQLLVARKVPGTRRYW
jgi:hypothetical protein